MKTELRAVRWSRRALPLGLVLPACLLLAWPGTVRSDGPRPHFVQAIDQLWGQLRTAPGAPLTREALAAAHATTGSGLSTRAAIAWTWHSQSVVVPGPPATGAASVPIPSEALLGQEGLERLLPEPDAFTRVLMERHGRARKGMRGRGTGRWWWKDGDLVLAWLSKNSAFSAAWEEGGFRSDPPFYSEMLFASLGASTLIANSSVVGRVPPIPTSVWEAELQSELGGNTPLQVLFGDSPPEVTPASGYALAQVTVQDRDGSILYVVQAQGTSDAVWSVWRYRPEWGYLNDRCFSFRLRIGPDGHPLAVTWWKLVQRIGLEEVAASDGVRRYLPRRVIEVIGVPPDDLVSSPDLADALRLTVWELTYTAPAADLDTALAATVEEALQEQWQRLLEVHERSGTEVDPSVRHHREYPQLLTDRRFFEEGVSTLVSYRWSRPLPSDAVIQQAAHTPGQSYLDPADRPPLPPGAPGGAAAAGSASPTLTRYARWKWWSWSVAGGALLLLAVLRLARGRRPRRAA